MTLPPPPYERSRVGTAIVHIGVGAFHRSHQAAYLDELLAAGGAREWGVCGVGMLPQDEAVGAALRRQDFLYTLVLKGTDGTYDARRIGSLREHLYAPGDPERVLQRLTDPAVRIVSLTITEGGYEVDPTDVAGPPRTVFRYVVEALRRRRQLGIESFTVLSCDNIERNGAVARDAFAAYAQLLDPALADWLREQVAFPSSMVDRITPATTDADRQLVRERWGVDDEVPVVAEPFAQWVLEDLFPMGRPRLEQVGVQLVDDVRPYEVLKLRLLNGGHQAVAYAGALRGHESVADAVADPLVAELLTAYLDEAVPTLPAVPGVDVPSYRSSLHERFGNRAIGDTVARLCAFSSDRIPKFVLPVAQERLDRGLRIDACAAVVACWARFRGGIDEQGRPLQVVDTRDLPVGAALARSHAAVGDLAEDPRFVAAVDTAVERLERGGVQALVRR